MRLHRIRIYNFRGVLERRLEFATLGITVIVGPNETGKSSLAEGFNVLLQYPHDSKSRDVLALKPIGRDVGPEVEAEISVGDYHFVYRKRWLKGTETVLELTKPILRQYSGRDAHDKVREILDSSLDSALFDALQYVQGQPVSQHGFEQSSSLMTALDLAMSTTSAEPDIGNSLIEAIESEYARFFTSTGQPKGERKDLPGQIAEATNGFVSAKQRLNNLENRGRELLEATDRLLGLEVRQAEVAAEWGNYADRLRELDQIERSISIAEQSLSSAEERLAGAEREVVRRADLVKAVNDSKVKHRQLVAELATEQGLLRNLSKKAAELKIALVEMEKVFESAKSAERSARRELELREAQVAADLLGKRVREFDEAEAQRIAATQILESDRSISEKVRKSVDEALSRLVAAHAVLNASQPTLAIEALGSLRIMSNDESSELVSGETQEWRVDGALEIKIEEVATIRVSGPTDLDAANEVIAAQSSIDKLVATFRLDPQDPRGNLDRRLTAIADAKNDLRRADERQNTALNDLTVEKLKAKLANARDVLNEFGLPSGDLDVDAARELVNVAASDLKHAESVLGSAQRERSQADDLVNDQRSVVARLEGSVGQFSTECERNAETLRFAREVAPDDELEGAAIGIATEVALAKETLSVLRAQRDDASPDVVRAEADNLQAKLKRFEREASETRSRRDELNGELRSAGSLDVQADLQDCQDKVDDLTRRRDALERRSRAAKLLFDVFLTHRETARTSRAKPFADEVNRLGQFVFGHDVSLEIDPSDFRVVARTLNGTSVPYEQLSTGAKEQISILCALSCAILVNPGGVSDDVGAPVILDDVLGFADPDRLKKLGPVFAEAAKSAQVILLTASPERYEAIGEATFVRW